MIIIQQSSMLIKLNQNNKRKKEEERTICTAPSLFFILSHISHDSTKHSSQWSGRNNFILVFSSLNTPIISPSAIDRWHVSLLQIIWIQCAWCWQQFPSVIEESPSTRSSCRPPDLILEDTSDPRLN